MKVNKKLFLERLKESFDDKTAKALSKKYGKYFKKDLAENIAFVKSLFELLYEKQQSFLPYLNEYFSSSHKESLPPNSYLSENLYKDFQRLSKLTITSLEEMTVLSQKGNIQNPEDLSQYEETMYHLKELYRYLASQTATLFTSADWRSPSYTASRFSNRFYLEDKDKSVCNYKRYGFRECEKVETWYKEELLDQKHSQIKSLVTASGMSAYAVIEDFLSKYVLEKKDLVMTSPYIYFENYEQLTLARHGNIKQFTSYDADKIVKEVKKNQPKAIFLDPMTNTGEIKLTDLFAVVEALDNEYVKKPLYIVVDTTVLAEGCNLFTVKNFSNKNVHLITFESCNKYKQLGMELLMLGVLTAPTEDWDKLERSRRNMGLVPSDHALHMMPRYSKQLSLYRFGKISRNAEILSKELSQDSYVTDVFSVGYARLTNHPYRKVSNRYSHLGGLVTLLFKDQNLCDKKHFDEFIEQLLPLCQESSVPVNHGISFGFEVTRVSASASMATTTDPFLRIAMGPDLIHNVLLLARKIQQTSLRYEKKANQFKKSERSVFLQEVVD